MIILKLYTAIALPITLLKTLVRAYSFCSILFLQHTAIINCSNQAIRHGKGK